MCRLLCWASTSARPLNDVLGDHGRSQFTELSRLHDDGWGFAGVEEVGSTTRVERSVLPAFRDELLSAVTTTAFSSCVVHFRKASPGIPVEIKNNHPFLYDNVAFAHNGSIHPLERLDDLLTPQWRRRMTGTTDSELYFLAIMTEVEKGLDLSDAIDVVVTKITRDFETSSLNAMLLTPDSLYVINSHDPAKSPGPDMEPDGKPYYQLRLRRTAHAVVVASSGFPQLDDEGWETLANHTLLRIDLTSTTTSASTLGSKDIVANR